MIRQNIILGKYTYIVDLYKASIDMSNKHYEEFVILKTNYVTNSIMFDKDVFFIKKTIFDKCIGQNGEIDTNLLGEMIAFPITNESITMSYSANYTTFNPNYRKETFNLEDDSDILKIYDKDGNPSLVLCDKLRIWLPITNSKLKSVIHVSNLINDIRFHYISENIANYESDSNGEMKVGNDIYSEYIDIWIPNIENLFSPQTHYVKENYNFTKFKQKISFVKSETQYMTIYPCIYYERVSDVDVQKRLSIEAFKTYDMSEQYSIYLIVNNEETLLDWDIMSLTYTYPYSIYDEDDFKIMIKNNDNDIIVNVYDINQSEIIYNGSSLYCSTFLMVLPFFVDEQQNLTETYACKTFFNTEKNLLDNILVNPIIVSLYPFTEINNTTKTYEADEKPENTDVFTLSKDIKMATDFEFNANLEDGDKNYGVYMLNCKFNYHPTNNENLQDFYLDKVKLTIYDYLNDTIVENGDYDDDIFNPNIKKCGYVIEMAKDSLFKDILYEYVINMDIVDENSTIIEDTKFKLNFNIKDVMWNAYPETLVARVKYEDKLSYTIIGSNPIFVTKENFKYIINDETSRLALLDINQNLENQPATHKYNNLEDMAFNFIDKINCTIISKENDDTNTLTNSKTNQRIIYKPVFYKAKDLQQIKLKNGITQNIGLNLSDMISKADTFKIVIDSMEYPEIARNDAFVIFRINAQELKTSAGQYNLIDQDDQFISDGTWYIY